jgi:hypothetical protein
MTAIGWRSAAFGETSTPVRAEGTNGEGVGRGWGVTTGTVALGSGVGGTVGMGLPLDGLGGGVVDPVPQAPEARAPMMIPRPTTIVMASPMMARRVAVPPAGEDGPVVK